jgi:hypothetical protein
MKLLLTSSAVGVALALSPAYAQQPPPASPETEGEIIVQGVEPSEVLGAIETEKLVAGPPAESDEPQPPTSKTEVIVDTEVQRTADAKIETTTEVIKPVSARPPLDPETPIAPEVQAVVDSKRNYTTADIVLAQLEAVRNTPVVQPTTTITTTTVTPDPG